MKNKWSIPLIISILLFVIAMIMMITRPDEIENANKNLNTTQIIALLKQTPYDLTVSSSLQEGSITTDSMIKFALSYMGTYGGYSISYVENNTMAIARKQDITQVITYIFGKQVDFADTSYKVNNDSIYIPITRSGTDAQIYKLKSKEYNEAEGTYIAYIDVLEVGFGRFSELKESSVIDYSEQEVMLTMVFKYKQEQGRNVLLAYNLVSNW